MAVAMPHALGMHIDRHPTLNGHALAGSPAKLLPGGGGGGGGIGGVDRDTTFCCEQVNLSALQCSAAAAPPAAAD